MLAPTPSSPTATFIPPTEQPGTSLHPQLAMWRAVIVQTQTDATSNVTHANPKIEAECRRVREEARSWLLDEGDDYLHVCMLADVDPDALLERSRLMQKRRWAPLTGHRGHIADTLE